MKMREEFEVAFTKMMTAERNASQQDIDRMLRRIGQHQEYADRFTAAAWWAWQASRAAIRVWLPLTKDLGFGPAGKVSADTWNGAIMVVTNQLESLGLTVKP